MEEERGLDLIFQRGRGKHRSDNILPNHEGESGEVHTCADPGSKEARRYNQSRRKEEAVHYATSVRRYQEKK